MESDYKRIPAEGAETPVMGFGGYLFKNKALHCRPRHMFPVADLEQAEQIWVDAIELYLANYCEPVRNIANEIHCVACNARLTGPQGMQDWRTRGALAVDETSSTLEARCTGCGYPARCNHKITLPDGRLVVAMQWLPLQYHPTALDGRVRTANSN